MITSRLRKPTQAQLDVLQQLGIEHAINLGLHSHEKALPDEAGSLAVLGKDYVHIPVAFNWPTEEGFLRFCDALAAIGDKPVHIHCIANKRVMAFLYRYQREVLGHDGEDARKLMDSVW